MKSTTFEQISQPVAPFKTEDTVEPQKLKELGKILKIIVFLNVF